MLQGSFNKYSKPINSYVRQIIPKNRKKKTSSFDEVGVTLIAKSGKNSSRKYRAIYFMNMNFKILNIILDNQIQLDFLKNS